MIKEPAKKKRPVGLYVAAAVVVLGLVAFLTTGGDGGDGTSVREIADVSVTGGNLPTTPEGGEADPAVGMAMPEVRGQDFDGTPVTIANDGRPKAIILLAHW